jgi:hypothetical protein
MRLPPLRGAATIPPMCGRYANFLPAEAGSQRMCCRSSSSCRVPCGLRVAVRGMRAVCAICSRAAEAGPLRQGAGGKLGWSLPLKPPRA